MSGITAVLDSLLETKFYAPQWRRDMVSRPRLVERIHQGVQRKVTLVCAPAGFGKTTLLGEWLSENADKRLASTWISLDTGDNDPTLFWSYIIAAIQRIKLGIGESALPLLYASPAPPITTILTTLINDISTIPFEFALILDDYHIIENDEVHTALAFFLDHLPHNMHLVIASRAVLPFPTARLRAQRELTEVLASDLQFSTGEVASFLTQSMGLDLEESDISILGNRTEGWVAGLQLAALSLSGRTDTKGFIEAFAGDDRYIADFLVEEILQYQTENVRRFLLHTSVLGRLSYALCDAVTGRKDSKKVLSILEQENLFLIPLDDKRQWYRYHHLFGDALRERLLQENPDQVSMLHERASLWYEQSGFFSEAIRYAFDSAHLERVAHLVERAANKMYSGGQAATLYSWLHKLPDSVLINRPVLSFWRGWAYMDTGEMESSGEYFKYSEEGLKKHEAKEASEGVIVSDKEQFGLLPGRLATGYAMHAQANGDIAAAINYSKQALELLPQEDFLWRGGTTVVLGMSSWMTGDLEQAYQAIHDGFAIVQKLGQVYFQVAGVYLMADIRVAQGRLHDALEMYRRTLRLVEEQHGPVIRGTADLYLYMSEIVLEQGKTEESIKYLEKGKSFGEEGKNIESIYRWLSAEARLKEVLGDMDASLELLAEAEHQYIFGPVPVARPLDARKAQVWIRQGRLGEVRAWVKRQELSVDDPCSYMSEYKHITLARLLIAQYRNELKGQFLDQACQLLTSLEEAAREGGRVGSLIEVLMLQAIVLQFQSNHMGALESLGNSLTLAEPERFVQVFIDEGELLVELLKRAIEQGIAGEFARELYQRITGLAREMGKPQQGTEELIDPLSQRELEVLRLIAAGLRNQEIADQLFISVATVKRHISNMYGKLEVAHRTEAIVRAKEVGLL